jgi:hypothetical protein
MCRPATDVLDEYTIPIGIPCAAVMQPGSQRYYFVHVASVEQQRAGAPSPGAVPGRGRLPQPLPIAGLKLGPLLGCSPYGRTYRAFYKGSPAAVKVQTLLLIRAREPAGTLSGAPSFPAIQNHQCAWRAPVAHCDPETMVSQQHCVNMDKSRR